MLALEWRGGRVTSVTSDWIEPRERLIAVVMSTQGRRLPRQVPGVGRHQVYELVPREEVVHVVDVSVVFGFVVDPCPQVPACA